MPLSGPTRSADRFRHAGTIDTTSGSASERFYLAGTLHENAVNISGQFSSTAGQLVAMPYWTGRGGVIESTQLRFVSGGTPWHVGLYANLSPSTLYPSTLLFSGADQAAPSTAGFVGQTGLAWNMPPEQLVWPVLQTSAAMTMSALPVASQWPILGYNDDATNYQFPGTCWLASSTFATLPTTFPAGASAGLASALPALFMRYSG